MFVDQIVMPPTDPAILKSCVACDRLYCVPHVNPGDHECGMSRAFGAHHRKSSIDPFCPKCITSRKDADSLSEENEKLFRMLELSKSENNQLKRELRNLTSKIFDASQELKKASEDQAKFNEMKTENSKLTRQNMILGELYQSTKEKLDCLNSNHFIKSNTIWSLNHKISQLEKSLLDRNRLFDNKSRDFDYIKAKSMELEEEILEKSKDLQNTKDLFKRCREKQKERIRAEERTIESQEQIIHRLQLHIIDLNSKLGISVDQDKLEGNLS